jgi:hypothetical protein
MIEFIEASAPVEDKPRMFLISGEPGIGKSSFAMSIANAAVLDFEGGDARDRTNKPIRSKSTAKWLTVNTQNYEQVKGLIPKLKEQGFGCIVIDTVKSMQNVMTEYVKSIPNSKLGNNTQRIFGALLVEFNSFNQLIKDTGLDIVFLAHIVEKNKNDETKLVADITGASKNDLQRQASVITLLQFDQAGNRFLNFEQNSAVEVKGPSELLQMRKIQFHENDANFGTDFIKMVRDMMKSSLAEVNKTLASFDENTPKAQKASLVATATKLGYRYDKELKQFVA